MRLFITPALLLSLCLASACATSSPPTPPHPSPQLATVTLITTSMDPMVAFYRDALGWELQYRDGNSYAQFAGPGVHVAISSRANMQRAADGHTGFSTTPRGHAFELALRLPTPAAVDAFYAHILAHGATPVAAPADKPWGQRVAFYADPDGNIHDVFAYLVPPDNPGAP